MAGLSSGAFGGRPSISSGVIAAADVVVVGSGGAGLCAACAAVRTGAEVIVVTKGRAGIANATAYAGGGFTVSPLPHGHESLTPEEHLRLSLETGRCVNRPELIRFLCFEGPGALKELERDFGVEFDWFSRGCSVARFGRPPLLGGLGLTVPLMAYLRRAGVRVVEGAVVTAVLREGDAARGGPGGAGSVSGVEAVITDGGSTIRVAAPSVVVATGGAGAIYGRTDNPPRLTGDGYHLLHQAGATLEDMEFVQFYPLGIAEPGLPARLLDLSYLDHARLTDENGDEPLCGELEELGFVSGSQANLYARDRLAVILGRHIAAGHRLKLHTEELPGAGLSSEEMAWIRGMFPRSFNPFSRPVAVAPTQHYFCGGARISTGGEVLDGEGGVIPGLYACGEVTGGVDGANRVGGNALTNIVTFGLAAGKAAAGYAAEDKGARPGAAAGPGREGFQPNRSRVSGERPSLLRRELHALSDRHLGPVRSGAGLQAALAGLEELAHRTARASAPGPAGRLLLLEMEFAVASARFVARAALLRTESRGSHFRTDYPVEDPGSPEHVALGPVQG